MRSFKRRVAPRRRFSRGVKKLPSQTWINRYGGAVYDGILTPNQLNAVVLADAVDVGGVSSEQVTMSVRRIVGRFSLEPDLNLDDIPNINPQFLREDALWLATLYYAFMVVPADFDTVTLFETMRTAQFIPQVNAQPVNPTDNNYWTFLRPMHFQFYQYHARWRQDTVTEGPDVSRYRRVDDAVPGARFTNFSSAVSGKVIQSNDSNPSQYVDIDLNVNRRWTKRDRLVFVFNWAGEPSWWDLPAAFPNIKVNCFFRTLVRHDE